MQALEAREPLASELRILERSFEAHAQRQVRELLEVGCGLGTTLIPLLRRGYWVRGLDIQREAVIACRHHVQACGLSTRVHHGDARTVLAEAEFDACLLLRGRLALLPEEPAQLEALRRLRKALRPGGLLILDHRNLLAMWPVFGRKRVRHESLPDGRALELGRQATIISVEGRVHERRWAAVGGQYFEQHDHLRITTVSETCSLLRHAGFDLAAIEAHPLPEGPFGTNPDDPAYVWIVARRPH
nr:class I SAM-dependent methyltransferase [Pseudenhygromyxa sp. WMMC2535]